MQHVVTILECVFQVRRNRDDACARVHRVVGCLLYTSDAADERSSVDLGGRRILKKQQIDMNVADASIILSTHKNIVMYVMYNKDT